MKKILLVLLIAFTFLAVNSNAQVITVQADTAAGMYNALKINDLIKNVSSSDVIIKWQVTGTDYPADWSSISICDNIECYDHLWNADSMTGPLQTSNPYKVDSIGDFHLQPGVPEGASSGTHYIIVKLMPQVSVIGANKNVVFKVTKNPLGVSSVVEAADDIITYPNPATNSINVVYNNDDVKTVAVYNIIGRQMSIYKVSGTSANINLENVPSGVYFLRLMNSQGGTIATRKFTRQ